MEIKMLGGNLFGNLTLVSVFPGDVMVVMVVEVLLVLVRDGDVWPHNVVAKQRNNKNLFCR